MMISFLKHINIKIIIHFKYIFKTQCELHYCNLLVIFVVLYTLQLVRQISNIATANNMKNTSKYSWISSVFHNSMQNTAETLVPFTTACRILLNSLYLLQQYAEYYWISRSLTTVCRILLNLLHFSQQHVEYYWISCTSYNSMQNTTESLRHFTAVCRILLNL